MTLLEKIFGRKKRSIVYNSNDRAKQIQETTDKLWKVIEEALQFYNSLSCQCAFPRFRQYISIDCSETVKSFYMSETEGFIRQSHHLFDILEVDRGQEVNQAIYTCKKCGSTYNYAWSDFSIHVDRSYLKPRQISVEQIGADPSNPIPFVVGLFGHSLPDRNLFRQVDLDFFKKYITELKNGA